MSVEQFITCVFVCLIDDLYVSLITQPLRKRGTPPKLSDSEAIAIEITGEWIGSHCDKDIWKYFKQHWSHLFRDCSLTGGECQTFLYNPLPPGQL